MPSNITRMSQPADQTPLYVDLDGTLIADDLAFVSARLFWRQTPWKAWMMAPWLMKGRARLKWELAKRVKIPIDRLPYRKSVLDFLNEQKKKGRRLILATGSNETLARQVAGRLGLFDDVIASDQTTNRTGPRKLLAIRAQCGPDGFSYIGDSRKDLVIWKEARQVFVVDHRPGLLQKVKAFCEPVAVFSE